MIVVVGSVAYRSGASGAGSAAGLAAEVAAAAAASGSAVELLARIGEDGAGEELLLALARAQVGHAAILRDPARPTLLAPEPAAPEDGPDELAPGLVAIGEPAGQPPGDAPETPDPAASLEPADLSLGLRYLRDFDVLVAVEPLPAGGSAVVADAASFAGAAVVVVVDPGSPAPSTYGEATLIEAPADDPEGAFARLVGHYAAALDRGVTPAEAFRGVTDEGGWQLAID